MRISGWRTVCCNVGLDSVVLRVRVVGFSSWLQMDSVSSQNSSTVSFYLMGSFIEVRQYSSLLPFTVALDEWFYTDFVTFAKWR